MPVWAVPLAAALGLAALFAAAWAGRRFAARGEARPILYALALCVYCTSWTFYGAVGTAARTGWAYLPIYLGPALVLLFGAGFLRRMIAAAKAENATSIADFIAARHGRSRELAAGVALVATVGYLPYVALQLKSVGMAYGALAGAQGGGEPGGVMAFVAAGMAAFAVLFGARTPDASGRNAGLVAAMAAEAVIKLAAFLAVGLFAVALLAQQPVEAQRAAWLTLGARFRPEDLGVQAATILILSMAAIVCLPRQFHMTAVEAAGPNDARRAPVIAPLYLFAFAAVALPIAAAGLAFVPAGTSSDLYVLTLPLTQGREGLALVAFVGGMSAALCMVIVAMITLSTMLTNEVLVPAAMRLRLIDPSREPRMAQILVGVRRVVIVALMALAYLYCVGVDRGEALASIGLVSFAAAAQFAPALVGAVLWPRANARGAQAGLAVGFAIWAYTLLAPSYLGVDHGFFAAMTMMTGGLADPQALFGLSLGDPLTHATAWSLTLNAALYVGVGLLARPAAGRESARQSAAAAARQLYVAPDRPRAIVGDLAALTQRVVGPAEAARALARLSRLRGRPLGREEPADADAARVFERALAGALGASSARIIMASALSGAHLSVEDALHLLEERHDEARFNRALLQATLEHLSQGVSVIDKDQRLVAWNSAYARLLGVPRGVLRVGLPIAEVIRRLAARGEATADDIDAYVARRVARLAQRLPHVYERTRPDGTVLKTLGNPMPDGGYVTSYTDITEEKRAQTALETANERLEERVAARTSDLEASARRLRAMADELHRAKRAAEVATVDKTKFLAAASHDLRQPLNAARLFAAALDAATAGASEQTRTLVRNIDRSIANADRLLRALLDVSKLDAGGVTPQRAVVALDDLLDELATEFSVLAAEKGLSLRVVRAGAWIDTDPGLMRSILQNFLSNAVRYTREGGVLIGVRRRDGRVRVEVWDTGPGIPDGQRDAVFEEFRRLSQTRQGGDGVGLGLAIVKRLADLLDHPVTVRSRVGRGSVFAVEAPRAPAPAVAPRPAAPPAPMGPLAGLSVLCVDNDPAILDAMAATLSRWGCRPRLAATLDEALRHARAGVVQAVLIDLHLSDGVRGFDVIAALEEALGERPPGALVTADASSRVAARAARLGYPVLRKPVEAAALRALLSRCARLHAQAAQ